jgi:AraC-like DNA-binding protein
MLLRLHPLRHRHQLGRGDLGNRNDAEDRKGVGLQPAQYVIGVVVRARGLPTWRGASSGELCEPLGIGRRQLERRFQRDVGLSPADYRHKLRLERARWLLQHTDLEVTEVALECGFQDSANFARVVRRELGASPREVRAAGRKSGDRSSSDAEAASGA